jgi:hypothetical protein
MLFKDQTMQSDHNKIWQDSVRNTKDCFSKVINEIFTSYFQTSFDIEYFSLKYIENIM